VARIEYNRGFAIPLGWGEFGEGGTIVVRLHVIDGRRLRLCVSLAVTASGGRRSREIVRFDDAHGRFHRHASGDPPRVDDREYLDRVPENMRIAYAVEDIRANADRYVAEARRAGYEVVSSDEAD
jgi:hypothetical protein